MSRLRWPGLLCCALAVAGCTPGPGISMEINGQFRDSQGGDVDLAKAYPANWDRVCILGPYSDNATAKSALGFDWDIEGQTAIHTNDGLSLLLFVRQDKVLAAVEHPRAMGDFTKLSGKCFARARARFYQVQRPEAGGPGLFPKDLQSN